MTVGNSIDDELTFEAFCRTLNRLEKKPGSKRNTAVAAEQELARLFTVMRSKMKNRQGQLLGAEPESMYGILRLLLPKLDTARGAYGLKEKAMATLMINVLSVNKNAPDAVRLLNYKAPSNASSSGDFAAVAFDFLRNRCPQNSDPSITIRTVNEWLDGMAKANADNDGDSRVKIMRLCMRSLTAQQNMWLIRIIVKDMKLKVGQNKILNSFHPDGKEFFDANGSLEKVATTLTDPGKRLNEIEVTLFTPFRPMLAERTSLDSFDKDTGHAKALMVEIKVDGERCQLHKDGDTYKYFSRNMFDYSQQFGADPQSGTITQFIHGSFKPSVKSCIIDGEMVCWHKDYEYIAQKGENIDVKKLKVGGVIQPCFIVFDILYLNGKVVTNEPLRERYRKLFNDVFLPKPGRLMFSQHQELSSKREVVEALNDAIEQNEEGLVVKLPDSKYIPAARARGWFKLKPEYIGSIMDELDLLIIGGYYGKGARAGHISQFLLGLAVPPANPGDKPKEFHSVCRVGSGLKDEVRIKMSDKLKTRARRVDPNRPPRSVLWAREKPEVWFEPSDSAVVQIMASEIVVSDVYKVGFTLRFPRITAWRTDKDWSDSMTTAEFHDLRRKNAGKLVSQLTNYRSDDSDDEERDDDSGKKKIRKRPGERRVLTQHIDLAKQFKPADVSSIQKTSEIFAGKEFLIIGGVPGKPKDFLEKEVHRFGGTFTQNATAGKTFCIVTSEPKLRRVQNYAKAGVYDIVFTSWLVRCLERGKLLSWQPMDMVSMSPETAAGFVKDFDVYGDSYYKPATRESLEYSMSRVKELGKQTKIDSVKIYDLESSPLWSWSPGSNAGLFQGGIVAYFHVNEKTVFFSPLKRLKAMFEFYGGQVTGEVHARVSHVVVDRRDFDEIPRFNALNRQRKVKFRLVYDSWIEDCIECQDLVAEERHAAVLRKYHP